jgi:hypothetical protein
MKYANEMGSGVMTYIPSLIKIGSGIQKLIGGDSQTHRQHGDLIRLLLFFQNKESRLKKEIRDEDSNHIQKFYHNTCILL